MPGLRKLHDLLMRQPAHELAIVLAVALGATLDLTGALHVYGMSGLMGQKLALGAALVLVGIAGGWIFIASLPPQPASDTAGLGGRGRQRLLALLILCAWLATARNVLVFLVPEAGPLEWSWFALGALALMLAVLRPPRKGLLGLALVLGTGTRVLCMQRVALDPQHSDMLPLVQEAIKHLLAGQNPYTIYTLPWQLPLTYLPATWLAYLPAQVAGFDLRLTNLVAELIVGAAIIWRGGAFYHGTGSLLWAWVFLQPSMLNWSLTTTAPIWWALLVITLVLIQTRRRGLWLALGLGVAASPFAAVVWPFIFLLLLQREGLRQTIHIGAGAALCAAALIGPFFLWDPQMFSFGVWRWFNDLTLFPSLRWEMDHTWASMTGFGGIFWRRNLEHLLKPIQLSIIITLLALFWRQKAPADQLTAYTVVTLILFTVFNPVLWPYLYNHGLIAALLALGAYGRAAHPAPEHHEDLAVALGSGIVSRS